ncbi:MAG TPA: hypothetical protein PK879_08520 [Opitutaceae bacterium]|jgi:hypothetical protein|nr:hypothetical protein [Opitutaceae bacterium]HPO00738.1 hypothetical protein [Opitutaceae bacterium]
MIAAFTICSNNYLAHALTLAASVRIHAPEWKFFIGLVDQARDIPGIAIPPDVEVLPVDRLGLSDLLGMVRRYGIIELCTAVKPTYFRWLFSEHPEFEQVHYLDPDTRLFSEPTVLVEPLRTAAVLLTLHHLTPIPLDGKKPDEALALNHGIFNLGYLGLRRSATSDALLGWWEERMREHCRIDLREGYFVDQLWFNYVPHYFPKVAISRDPGINTAYWNLHEREITPKGCVRFAGQEYPLVLFHFSGFSPLRADRLTRIETRQSPELQPALRPLLANYASQLIAHGFHAVHTLESTYVTIHRAHAAAEAAEHARHHPWRAHMRKIRAGIPESIKRLLRS